MLSLFILTTPGEVLLTAQTTVDTKQHTHIHQINISQSTVYSLDTQMPKYKLLRASVRIVYAACCRGRQSIAGISDKHIDTKSAKSIPQAIPANL